jgi:hypothetical protein
MAEFQRFMALAATVRNCRFHILGLLAAARASRRAVERLLDNPADRLLEI